MSGATIFMSSKPWSAVRTSEPSMIGSSCCCMLGRPLLSLMPNTLLQLPPIIPGPGKTNAKVEPEKASVPVYLLECYKAAGADRVVTVEIH